MSTLATFNDKISYNICYAEVSGGVFSGVIPPENVVSVSVSYNYNADSTATITVAKSDYTDNLIIGNNDDEITVSLKAGVAGSSLLTRTFIGYIKNISHSADTITFNISNRFNESVRAGNVKELNYFTPTDLEGVFGIIGTPSVDDYSKYFDTATNYYGSYYYVDSGNTLSRKIIDKNYVTGGGLLFPKIVPDIVSSSGINVNFTNLNKTSSTPNVYDILLNVKFKRYARLVKSVALSSTLNLPSGIRTTETITPPGGTSKTFYKTYDRPPRLSAIREAINNAGWTVDESTLVKSHITSNYYDFNNTDLIYTAVANDDISSMSCKVYRDSVQEVTLPYIVRIINNDSLLNTGQVVYKRIDKVFEYTSNVPTNTSTNFSSYIDVYDWTNATHEKYLNDTINKVKYEMKGSANLFKYTISANLNIMSTTKSTNIAINEFPPFDIKAPPYNASVDFFTLTQMMNLNFGDDIRIESYKSIVFNYTYNFDNQSGSATLSLNCKTIDENLLSPGSANPIIPAQISVIPTSSPHDATGSGLLQVNGSSSNWLDDNDWAFENDITLTRYYSHYVNPTTLADNVDPELTVTNYYAQSVYVNGQVDQNTLPFSAVSSQCKIKHDKGKSVYTKAITVPPVIIPDIII